MSEKENEILENLEEQTEQESIYISKDPTHNIEKAPKKR